MATFQPTTTLANTELDDIFQSTFLSLHTGDPGITGADEVTGGSYARQAENFSAAASGAITNASAISFTGMPACTVIYVGFWTLVSGGTFKGYIALSSAPGGTAVLVGQTAQFAAGDLDITMP